MNSGRNIKNYIIPLSEWEWNIYSIPIAIVIILISNGFFISGDFLYFGNNGLNGDFGLDYCNHDNFNSITNEMNSAEVVIEETESVELYPNSFFACELGYVNGVVDLGWIINIDDVGKFPNQVNPWWEVMILNHDNYRDFVNGENYGFSNFRLSELQASSVGAEETSKYEMGITLHSDTYFFVVDREYDESQRGLIGPNTLTVSTDNPLYFHYQINLDYHTS